MQIFLDTADISEITYLANSGLVDGVTTNPSIIAKSGADIFTVIKEICAIVKGPVSAEVMATDAQAMVEEGKALAAIAPNVVVKLPVTLPGLGACSHLSREGILVNMTLCFSVTQALLVAKAGAAYVSPFVGRLDDIAEDGMALIADICDVYANYEQITTQVLVASVRSPLHIKQAALLGADVITMPPHLLRKMVEHPLTERGIEIFTRDWQEANAKKGN